MRSPATLALTGCGLTLLAAAFSCPRTAPVPVSHMGLLLQPNPPLLLNEIMPRGPDDHPPWLELINPTNGKVSLAGLQLFAGGTDPSPIRSEVSELGPGKTLLVSLASGGAPPRPTHGHPVLLAHADPSLTTRWTGYGGWVGLLRADARGSEPHWLDAVAWGQPSTPPPRLYDTKRGLRPWFRTVPLEETAGVLDLETQLPEGSSVARLPGLNEVRPASWAVFTPEEAPRFLGLPNRLPAPVFFTPASDAVVRPQDLSIAWLRAHPDETYEVRWRLLAGGVGAWQVTTTRMPFFSPQMTEAPGTFEFQVRRILDRETIIDSSWSNLLSFWTRPTSCGTFPMGRAWKVLQTVKMRYQRKDTPLLCPICNSHRNSPHQANVWSATSLTPTPVKPPNPCGGQSEPPSKHGDSACARASISMIVSHYGPFLSQDRISFHTRGDRCLPGGDLGHGKGMHYTAQGSIATGQPPGGEISETLWWALGHPPVEGISARALPAPDALGFRPTCPEFDAIRTWIDDGRPVMTRRFKMKHIQVVNGYCVDSLGVEWLHVLDPERWPAWQTFQSWAGSHDGTWVAPKVARGARKDELSICTDSDGDGLADFDELYRFTTDPNIADAPTDSNGEIWVMPITPPCP